MEIKQTNIGKQQTVVNNEYGTVNIHNIERYTDLAGENTLHIFKEISNTEQTKFVAGFTIACFIPGISLIADLMQIEPALHLPSWAYILAFGILFLITTINFYDNFKILTSNTPNENQCRQLYTDKLFSKTETGFIIFTHTTNCIYPDCKGKIKIAHPPERYNGEYSFFGVCTLAGKQHSYGVDYNFKAYPRKVDWRRMPPPPSE